MDSSRREYQSERNIFFALAAPLKSGAAVADASHAAITAESREV
jgi:hypothetical protein